mmetsp:Transcript_180731/g.573590  ORF Transcript_180731/g.573590 Transcript_180731/m.573590 type:complete len:257 (-) Transcript_180731:250-1020(-)
MSISPGRPPAPTPAARPAPPAASRRRRRWRPAAGAAAGGAGAPRGGLRGGPPAKPWRPRQLLPRTKNEDAEAQRTTRQMPGPLPALPHAPRAAAKSGFQPRSIRGGCPPALRTPAPLLALPNTPPPAPLAEEKSGSWTPRVPTRHLSKPHTPEKSPSLQPTPPAAPPSRQRWTNRPRAVHSEPQRGCCALLARMPAAATPAGRRRAGGRSPAPRRALRGPPRAPAAWPPPKRRAPARSRSEGPHPIRKVKATRTLA